MTPQDFFTAIRDACKLMTWPAGYQKAGTLIFGQNVEVVPDFPTEMIPRLQMPSMFIMDGGASINPMHPNLLDNEFTILFFVENISSASGQAAMLGGNGLNGLLALETVVLKNIINTVSYSSNKVSILEKSKAKVTVMDGNTPLIFRTWTLEALLNVI